MSGAEHGIKVWSSLVGKASPVQRRVIVQILATWPSGSCRLGPPSSRQIGTSVSRQGGCPRRVAVQAPEIRRAIMDDRAQAKDKGSAKKSANLPGPGADRRSNSGGKTHSRSRAEAHDPTTPCCARQRDTPVRRAARL